MTALQHYAAGDLDAATAAATEDVKSRPTDAEPRALLGQLLCVAGDLERADKMFDAVGNVSPDATVWAQLQRGLIRGELARREVFEEGRPPKLMATAGEGITLRLEALMLLREGDAAAAAAKLEAAGEAAASLAAAASVRDGAADGDAPAAAPFLDLDDVLGAVLEVITATGEYYWIDASLLRSLDFGPTETISEQLWRPVTMTSADGQDGAVYMPTTYLDSGRSDDEAGDAACRLGRRTTWVGDEIVRGRGQREFQFGEEVRAVRDLQTVTFE